MSTFSESIEVRAGAGAVWNLLADIGSIYEWNPGVESSWKISRGKPGLGATRRCELRGKGYLDEDVVGWEPERALTMRVVETNLPFKRADIRFELGDAGDGTTHDRCRF